MRKLNFFLKIFVVMIFFLKIDASGSGEMVYGTNTLQNREMKLDINHATEEDMLRNKISAGHVSKLMEYRNITGGFNELSDMRKIKGIGDATYQKLSKKFKIDKKFTRKKYNINSADDKVLIYMGYSKDEIKKVRKYISEKGRVFSSVELVGLISEKQYRKDRDIIDY
ncbi:MAG: ComEA family DNA-binding protein [Fusobacteriaceae bacterium]